MQITTIGFDLAKHVFQAKRFETRVIKVSGVTADRQAPSTRQGSAPTKRADACSHRLWQLVSTQ
jgi:hypothetical protein